MNAAAIWAIQHGRRLTEAQLHHVDMLALISAGVMFSVIALAIWWSTR